MDLPQLFMKGCVHAHHESKKKKRKAEDPGISSNCCQEVTRTKYLRLAPGLYDQAAQAENDVPRLFDHKGDQVDVRILRPKRCKPETKEKDVQKEKNTYRIFHYRKVEDLWNIAIAGHRDWSPRCRGRLEFDLTSESQWGLCWIERLMCQRCDYKSPSMKLYEEVEGRKPGRKSGGPNRALQVGLSHCMIGNSAMRDILLALNIPAPSENGMQKQTNMVSQVLEDVNQEDMNVRLDKLVTQCELNIGQESIAPIVIEGDCRYNNPLGTSTAKTPYQPGTQAVYTISENVTSQKQIIGIACKNKLCKKAETLQKSDNTVTCPDHSGHCSANLKQGDSIGDEGQWVSDIFSEMFKKHPTLAIKYFTTDGDSRAFLGLQNIQGEASKVKAQQMRDTRHLSENMRNAVKREKFSLTMFPGPTKSARDKQQASFALELSKRCTAEFETCHKKTKGDLTKMQEELDQVPETLLLCYQGDCSLCHMHSFICGSQKKTPWVKGFQQKNMEIDPTENDKKLLLACINMRLGSDILAKTHLNTSTQKSEAFNRVLSRCNPKSVTLKRNFKGRINSAAHLTNCGINQSTQSKCAAVGAPLQTGTRVVSQLQQKDRHVHYIRRKMKSPKYKSARIDRRVKRYQQYHEEKAETVLLYQKGLEDCQSLELGDHTYVARNLTRGKRPSTSGFITNSKSRRKGDSQK